MTNGAADDAIDNTKDDDDNSTAEESPSAAAEEDCAEEAIDETVIAAAAVSSQRVAADVIRRLALLITDSWIQLATHLHFEQDDITYFQTENSTPTAQATNMLTLWAVSTCLFI